MLLHGVRALTLVLAVACWHGTHAVADVSSVVVRTVTGLHAVAGPHAVAGVYAVAGPILLLASLRHDVVVVCSSLAHSGKVLRENDNTR